MRMASRIRHKKCDEKKPSCTQCSTTGRHCDFEKSPTHNIPNCSSLPPYFDNQSTSLFDFFRYICAKDYALFFNSPQWEGLVLCAIFHESFAYHAALATSILTRMHYTGSHRDTRPIEYANHHYSLAIRYLNSRLDEGWHTAELAVLGSILFVNIEFLRATEIQTRRQNLIGLHVQGGLAILRTLQSRTTRPCLTRSWEVFEDALEQIRAQLAAIEVRANL